ncbi:hypothetical protein CROQUDRAFT_110764 [Cronartium quercuum f. sp. fusiforme G11]|uniref:Uncharacterized protein n=1 Tax=Cronartium quercuum f. sp. fusiforme G11 TaxID=708437 RepID=A0A9P6N7X7_9BASI|nr:hypothetical protein CROQUDRAFT_110764 [Cronartium quercuum f. sp. fusiforme G11]
MPAETHSPTRSSAQLNRLTRELRMDGGNLPSEPPTAGFAPSGHDLNSLDTHGKVLNAQKIYIGGLPDNVRPEDLRDCFSQMGAVRLIELKAGYGFVRLLSLSSVFVYTLRIHSPSENLSSCLFGIQKLPLVTLPASRRSRSSVLMLLLSQEYDNPQSATDAVTRYHEGHFMGSQIRVEISHGGSRPRHIAVTHNPEACYCCGIQGHWARDCPDADLHPQRRRIRPRSRSPLPIRDDGYTRPVYDHYDPSSRDAPRNNYEKDNLTAISNGRAERARMPPPLPVRNGYLPPAVDERERRDDRRDERREVRPYERRDDRRDERRDVRRDERQIDVRRDDRRDERHIDVRRDDRRDERQIDARRDDRRDERRIDDRRDDRRDERKSDVRRDDRRDERPIDVRRDDRRDERQVEVRREERRIDDRREERRIRGDVLARDEPRSLSVSHAREPHGIPPSREPYDHAPRQDYRAVREMPKSSYQYPSPPPRDAYESRPTNYSPRYAEPAPMRSSYESRSVGLHGEPARYDRPTPTEPRDRIVDRPPARVSQPSCSRTNDLYPPHSRERSPRKLYRRSLSPRRRAPQPTLAYRFQSPPPIRFNDRARVSPGPPAHDRSTYVHSRR